jgi:hypothetical protein
MFRHFAMLTVAVTALLGMFATGENRAAFEQQLAERQEKNQLKAAELELAKQGKGGNTTLVFKDNRRKKGSWGPDPRHSAVSEVAIDGEGSPELGAGNGPQFVDLPSTPGQLSGQTTVAPPGMTSQFISELQKRKQQRLRKEGPPRRPPSEEEDEADY